VPAQLTSSDDETSDNAPVDEETKHTKSHRAEVAEPDIRPEADNHRTAARAEPTPENGTAFSIFSGESQRMNPRVSSRRSNHRRNVTFCSSNRSAPTFSNFKHARQS